MPYSVLAPICVTALSVVIVTAFWRRQHPLEFFSLEESLENELMVTRAVLATAVAWQSWLLYVRW